MTPLLGTTPKCNDHLKKKKKQTYEESNVKTFSKAFMNLVSITASVCDLFPSLHEAIKLFFFGNGTVIKFEWKKKIVQFTPACLCQTPSAPHPKVYLSSLDPLGHLAPTVI